MAFRAANIPTVTTPFRLLLWLKWTLMWRGIGRDRMRLIGMIVMLAIFTPMSVGLAIVCWLLAVNTPPMAPYILRAAFGFAYLLWLITPLLGFPLNESYDPTRLFIYPVSYRVIFAAAVAGGCFDLSTILVLPVFLALLIAISHSILAAFLSLVLIVLFLLQTIASAQALMLVLIGFLRSRRFRDITMVVLPLVGMAWYIAQQTMIHRFMLVSAAFRDVVQSPIWSAISWLPPGWAAAGMLAARDGNFGLAFLYMLLLAVVCAMMAVLAAYVMRQLYLGDRGPAVKAAPVLPAPAAPPARPNPSTPFPPGTGSQPYDAVPSLPSTGRGEGAEERGLLPSALSAVMHKELRYLWREPQYKVVAIQMIYTLVIFGLAFFVGNRPVFSLYGGANPTAPATPLTELSRLWLPFLISGILLMASLQLVFNVFGGEGPAITMLFSFPTPRRYLFLGKNLAHGIVVLAICVIGILLAGYLTHSLPVAPLALAWVVVALPVVLAAGNLVSIRFPHRMVVRGQRWGKSNQVSFGGAGAGTGAGCGYAFIYLACYLATFVALVPALAGIAIPAVFDLGAGWHVFGIVVALAYALAVYWACLYMASTWILSREAAIIERLVPNE